MPTTTKTDNLEALIDAVLSSDDPDQTAVVLLRDLAVRMGLEVVAWPRGDHVEKLHVTSTAAAEAIRNLADHHEIAVDRVVVDGLKVVLKAAEDRFISEGDSLTVSIAAGQEN